MKTTRNKFDAFTGAGIAAWERAAAEELQGANPWNKLTRERQGVSVKPFYTAEAASKPSIQLRAATDSFLGARTWYNSPSVPVKNPAEANAAALEHLRQGADGVFFVLDEPVDFHALLKSIEWPICALHFHATQHADTVAKALHKYLQGVQGPTNGAFFASPSITTLTHPSFHFAGFTIDSATSPDAIADTLIAAHRQMGNRFRTQASDVAFRIEVGTDFFLDASKLRAVRAVWERLLKATDTQSSPLFIHAWSCAWTTEPYEPHGNMLKATTAAMASILGGCDALTIDAQDPHNATMIRAARNVAIILREESHLSKVADPLAGAYFVDALTEELTDLIWNKVQTGLVL